MTALFIIIPIVILAILFLGYTVFYSALISIFYISNPQHSLILKIVLGTLWLSFIAASLISLKFNNVLTQILYKISAVWLGFFVYLFLAACLYAAIVTLFPTAPTTTSIIGKSLLGIAAIISAYGLIHAQQIKITSIKVPMPNLPAEWKSRKAVWVSDLHLGQIYGASFSAHVVSEIQKLKPDIVFIGGDLYDGVTVDTEKIIQPFRELQVPLGTYFITGNHEEFSDNSKYLSAIRKTGIKILMDEKIEIDGLQIIGVDNSTAAKKVNFEKILRSLNINQTLPSILLKHEPTNLDIAEQNGISLEIAGHTHRAQMFPFNFVTKLIYRGFDYGRHTFGKMSVYTSSGVGTWGPPLRIGTQSEIIQIQFY